MQSETKLTSWLQSLESMEATLMLDTDNVHQIVAAVKVLTVQQIERALHKLSLERKTRWANFSFMFAKVLPVFLENHISLDKMSLFPMTISAKTNQTTQQQAYTVHDEDASFLDNIHENHLMKAFKHPDTQVLPWVAALGEHIPHYEMPKIWKTLSKLAIGEPLSTNDVICSVAEFMPVISITEMHNHFVNSWNTLQKSPYYPVHHWLKIQPELIKWSAHDSQKVALNSMTHAALLNISAFSSNKDLIDKIQDFSALRELTIAVGINNPEWISGQALNYFTDNERSLQKWNTQWSNLSMFRQDQSPLHPRRLATIKSFITAQSILNQHGLPSMVDAEWLVNSKTHFIDYLLATEPVQQLIKENNPSIKDFFRSLFSHPGLAESHERHFKAMMSTPADNFYATGRATYTERLSQTPDGHNLLHIFSEIELPYVTAWKDSNQNNILHRIYQTAENKAFLDPSFIRALIKLIKSPQYKPLLAFENADRETPITILENRLPVIFDNLTKSSVVNQELINDQQNSLHQLVAAGNLQVLRQDNALPRTSKSRTHTTRI